MTAVSGSITAASGEFIAPVAEVAHELPAYIVAAIRSNKNQSAWWALQNAHEMLVENRPGDRSSADRCYAVTITEMEKVMAYFQVFVLDKLTAPPAKNYIRTVPAGENGAPLCPYCAGELIWTRVETHDKSGWIKGWLCGCQFEDVMTEAVG